jgi:hypothetical protein
VRTGRIVPQGPTFDQLGANLSTYQSRPFDIALDHFGYPDAEREVAGRKIYVWNVDEVDSVPDLATTSGTIGQQQFSATTSGSTKNMTAHCKITMAVDAGNIVKDVRYDGNMAGCARFIEPAATSSVANSEPTFPLLVASQEAAVGGRQLTGPELDKLMASAWANEEPRVIAARKGITEEGLAAEKASAYASFVKWKAQYLMQTFSH